MSTRKPDLDKRPWRQYICLACGLIYDEAEGDPDSGLPRVPGLRTFRTTGSAPCAVSPSPTSNCWKSRRLPQPRRWASPPSARLRALWWWVPALPGGQ